MPEIQASRRLVKSPPELWAEVSDAASLARHLGEVGEITITRLEPETTVAWEGEHASGTVELAPAGWGTSVTLTAEPVGEAPELETAPESALAPAPVGDAEPPAPDPEPPDEPTPAQPETIRIEEAAPTATPPRRGWFARLFRRAPEPQPPTAPAPSTPDADSAGGGEDARAPGGDPGCVRPEPTGPARQAAEPVAEEPEPAAQEPDPLEAVLTGALDSLGSAHHRPFSRG
jgi:hypothetical protein